MSSTSCLVLLSGIPASGKTTLAQLFEELTKSIPLCVQSPDHNIQQRTKVIHITYDSLIEDNLQLDAANAVWKQYRKQIHSCVDKVLNRLISRKIPLIEIIKNMEDDNSNQGEEEKATYEKFCHLLRQQIDVDTSLMTSAVPTSTIFILDDNFFYRSMRYEYFQLARKYSVGFCEVHITCPVKVAIARNSHRSRPVSEETYANMTEKMEEPCSDKAPWESNYLIVDGGCNFSHSELSEMWGLVVDSLQNPVQPLEEEDLEAKEAARAASLTSILHQADIILRRCVSESIKSKNLSTGEASLDVKTWAAKANDTRGALLDGIRNGTVILPPITHEQTADPGDMTPSEEFEDEIKRLFREALER